MRKCACDPDAEISGAAILSIVKSVMSDEYLPLIKKYDYDNLTPHEWYPLQEFLAFLDELFLLPHQILNLVAIGVGIAETALMPPELEKTTFVEMIKGWNAHYQANLRNGDMGQRMAVKLSDCHYKIILDGTKMPDDLEYGVLYGFARRFLSPSTCFSIWYDEDVLNMDKGGDQTVIHVSWG